MTIYLKFGVKVREVGGFEAEEFAHLPVEAQDRFEGDGAAELVEQFAGHGRFRRHAAARRPGVHSARIHLLLLLLLVVVVAVVSFLYFILFLVTLI